MTADISVGYQHQQRAPWSFLLGSLGLIVAIFPLATTREAPAIVICLGVSAVLLVFASLFHHLSVTDSGEELVIGFGPIPLVRRRIPYSEIVGVEIGQTTLLDGWGIHMSPRGGWVWNIWGWDCVVLTLRNSTLRVGTDEPERLAAFLQSKWTTR